jgi:23S rRNA (adenine2503-C2)-methyltransferase
MKVIAKTERSDIASVYLAQLGGDKYIEFVESTQPPFPKQEKWVIIVSTMLGCPVGCLICDAGITYKGRLSAAEIMDQIKFLVDRDFPGLRIPVRKFKIQFARMGEPSLNPAVLEVLDRLPGLLDAPGLMPSISTVAPLSAGPFFDHLLDVKNSKYAGGRFQLQFSIHTTDSQLRDKLVPIAKWSFEDIAKYGARYFSAGDRKITLNFALAEDSPLCADVLASQFDPDLFLIKLTPVNPTINARKNKIKTALANSTSDRGVAVIDALKRKGFQVIVSIGEMEENKIGSNCGQFVRHHLESKISRPADSYTYPLEKVQ